MIHATPESIASMLRGTPLVIMLDIDGTLCDLVVHADSAVVPDAVRTALVALEARRSDGVHVALVTGRSVADAQRMIGVNGIPIYGNHGMERLLSDGTTHGPDGFDADEARMRTATAELTRLTAEFPGTGVEDKRFSLSVHFRNMDEKLAPEFVQRASQIVERNGLRPSPGKCVINVVTMTGRNKGGAVREIIEEAAASWPDEPIQSILFVGDDVTDEDAFLALRPDSNAVTVRVGDAAAQSAARYSLDDPRAVRELLEALASTRT